MTDSVKELIERLKACANGVGDFKTDRGDYGLCDDAADTLKALAESEAALRERVGELEAMCQQAFGMACEGIDAPNVAYRWCERIDEVFDLGPQSEYNEFARPLPNYQALEAKS